MTQFTEVHIQAELILKMKIHHWGCPRGGTHFQESEVGFLEVSKVVSWPGASIGHMTICIL